MDAQRWDRIETMFAQALERDPAERAAFLDEACAGDLALRQEVESMLAAHATGRALLIEQRFLTEEAPEALMGTQAGAYRLVRELGRGGMGTVYLAERADEQYQGQVAVTVIRHGRAAPHLLLRCGHERRILASLHHPHIARL